MQEDQRAPQTADGGDPYVRAVCFSPDGLSIVAGMEKNSAKVLVLEEEGGRQGAITLSGHQVWMVFAEEGWWGVLPPHVKLYTATWRNTSEAVCVYASRVWWHSSSVSPSNRFCLFVHH